MSAIGKRLSALEQAEHAAKRVFYAWRNPSESSDEAIERCMRERGITDRAGIQFYTIGWGFELPENSVHFGGAT